MSDCEKPESTEETPARRVRASTLSMKRFSKRRLEADRALADAELEGLEFTRPVTRGDCLQGENAQRPCPFVSCKHHLALDVSEENGSIKFNFPHLAVWDMPETCALDVADRGGITLEEVGTILNKTRERIRQLETRGIAKLKALDEVCKLSDDYEIPAQIQRPDLQEVTGLLGKKETLEAHNRICGVTDPREEHQLAMAAVRLRNAESPAIEARVMRTTHQRPQESLEDWIQRRSRASARSSVNGRPCKT